MDYYILLGLNRKELKIMEIREVKGIIEVELKSKKSKVRCPECNNMIELDWDDEEEHGCSGHCSSCHGCSDEFEEDDDEENNEDVCLEYAKLLRNELNENDLVVMRKMEKKNAKLFKKINPCIYQNSWCLEEMASESVFVGVDEKYDDMPIEKKLLPKQARLGDFVSLDKNNQYVFNRDALLKHIKNLEKLSKGVR